MKRILQVVDSMGMGGIQAFIMNVYRMIDKSKYQFDFLLHHKYSDSYDDEIRKMGGNIYYLPARSDGVLKNRRALDEFFKTHLNYTVVHQHESSLTYIEPLIYARKYGIPTRIIHSHSTRASGNPIHIVFHQLNKKKIENVATNYFACGNLAAEWMFGETSVIGKVEIINNGIDVEKFSFNKTHRDEVKKEFNLEGKFVIGNIGRFSSVKNQLFLIDIFSEYRKLNPNSQLLLIGDGDMRNDIIKRIEALNLEDDVKLLGVRKDVYRIIQGIDFMIIPSLYEGFPVSVIEAQAAGIPCIISNTITRDAIIKNNVKQLKLTETAKTWAENIHSDEVNETSNQVWYENGFDIESTIKKLLLVYKSS